MFRFQTKIFKLAAAPSALPLANAYSHRLMLPVD